jgi:hypothetical protein
MRQALHRDEARSETTGLLDSPAQIAARTRRVRLDDFPPDESAAILAAIEAKRAAKAARAERTLTPGVRIRQPLDAAVVVA